MSVTTRVGDGAVTRRAPLSVHAKARLALEVLAAYPQARRAGRNQDLRAGLTALRDTRVPVQPSLDPAAIAVGRRLGRAVARTLGPLPVDSRCLTQSLVLIRLLARRGLHGSVVIAAKPGSDLVAHAWVEMDGQELLHSGDNELGRLVTL